MTEHFTTNPVTPAPAVSETNAPPDPTRRDWFAMLTYACGAAATAAVAIPVGGFMLGALGEREKHWLDLGPVQDFPFNETRIRPLLTPEENPFSLEWDGISGRNGVYVRRLKEKDEEFTTSDQLEKLSPEKAAKKQQAQFMVLGVNCAHLNCPVEWFPQSGLFMCPCHGGVYYENGARASGPPTRGMFTCPSRVVRDAKDGKLHLHVLAPHMPTLQDPLMPDNLDPNSHG